MSNKLRGTHPNILILDDIGMIKAKNPLRFMAGNYLERTTDACYVEIGDATVYFSNNKAIALIADNCLYRISELDSGITYKRVRAALYRQNPKKIQQVKRAELNTLIEMSIMTMARTMVEEKLGINSE